MSPKFQEIKGKEVKLKVFLTHPRVPFKVSQSVSQKNRPQCAKANSGLSFPGPFLLKPRPSQVSLVSRQLGNVGQVPGNRAQVGQIQSFPNPPSAPFKVSQSVRQKNRPHCAKANSGLSFPGPFLLKPRPSQVSLVSRQLGNVVQVPGN